MPAERGSPCRSILIVDNDRDSAESLAAALDDLGNDVEIASDETALAVQSRFKPEAVMIDLGLPGLGAYTVARFMRASPGARVALVALARWGQEVNWDRAHDAGFKYHLMMPADSAALQSLLAEMD